jgi:deoxyribonuclease-1
MNTDSGIHANKKSHVYHLSNCPGYAKVSEKNLTTFATEDEAVKAGFHKAKNCPK